jgi:hypothetical protein
MPQIQTFDLNQRTEPGVNPAEENIVKFFSKLGKDYKDKEDRVEIGKIIEEYTGNVDKAAGITQARKSIATGTLSPTKQLQANELINAEEKSIIERDKQLNSQVKAMADIEEKRRKDIQDKQALLDKEEKANLEKADKKLRDQNEVRETLLKAGETPEEADRLAPILSPAAANARLANANAVNKEKTKAKIKSDVEEESSKITQNAFNKLVPLIPKAGVGTGLLSYYGGENAKTYGEFSSLTGALEANLIDKVSRGTLSIARFKYIV